MFLVTPREGDREYQAAIHAAQDSRFASSTAACRPRTSVTYTVRSYASILPVTWLIPMLSSFLQTGWANLMDGELGRPTRCAGTQSGFLL